MPWLIVVALSFATAVGIFFGYYPAPKNDILGKTAVCWTLTGNTAAKETCLCYTNTMKGSENI
ncbi:MAG: hypothetical protein ACOX5W_07785 [Bacillota bacterium]